MDMEPRVSVCIPTIPGRENLLAEAIASVEASTERNFEIIVSKDESGDIAANWSAVCRRANAPYILKLDDDDLIEPEFLEKCCDFLDANPDVVIVYTGFWYERQGMAPVEKIDRINFNDGIVEGKKYRDDILFNRAYYLNHKSSGVFRREAAEEIDYFDHADTDLIFTMMISDWGDIGYLPKPLYRYRVHDSQHEGTGLRPLRMLIKGARLCYGMEADILIRGAAIRYVADSFLHGKGLETIREVLRLEPCLRFSFFFWLSIAVIFCLPKETYLRLLDFYIASRWFKRLTNVFIRT